jgi:hypothetical protein
MFEEVTLLLDHYGCTEEGSGAKSRELVSVKIAIPQTMDNIKY